MSPTASSSVSRRLAWWLLFIALYQGTALAAEPPDSIGQRMQACATCHGKEGRATNSGYFPRIAGKPAGYLYNQLINFRDGRRQNATMAYLLDHMAHEVARTRPRLNEPAGFEQVVRLKDSRRADAVTAARLTNRLHPVTRSKLTAGDGLRHLVCKSFVALHTSAVVGESECI